MGQTKGVLRRFGYYVPRDDGTVDVSVQDGEFTQELWHEFSEVMRIVVALRPLVISYLALEEDHGELRQVEAIIAQSLEGAPNAFGIVPAMLLPALARAQRHVSNFLGSAATFRDRILKWFATTYRDEPEIVGLPPREFSFAYDRSLAYRIMYNLRNYALHQNVPVSLMPITGTRSRSDGSMAMGVRLLLDTGELCGNPKTKGPVRDELLRLGTSSYEIVPLAAEYMESHARFMRFVLRFHADDLQIAQHYARAVWKGAKLPPRAIPVIWEGEGVPGAEPTTMNCHHLAFDELGFMRLLLDRLPTD
ncbi:hypothetical protein [Muricoccus radiodurans]|uniref:hypothetical protein n=1 Tax=Muricoccus radiodurans TaxID=2231721 RepID=UPI003CEDD059